jgi:hypothetical protein
MLEMIRAAFLAVIGTQTELRLRPGSEEDDRASPTHAEEGLLPRRLDLRVDVERPIALVAPDDAPVHPADESCAIELSM